MTALQIISLEAAINRHNNKTVKFQLLDERMNFVAPILPQGRLSSQDQDLLSFLFTSPSIYLFFRVTSIQEVRNVSDSVPCPHKGLRSIKSCFNRSTDILSGETPDHEKAVFLIISSLIVLKGMCEK